MKLTEILPKKVQELLSESSMSSLQSAIEDKIEIAVESALVKQDDLYSSKLVELMEATDLDRAKKMHKALKLQESHLSDKLKKVIYKYEREINADADKFKNTLVESISSYMDEFLLESIPVAAIEEATRNKTATTVLSNIREALSIDSALMKESVKEAVIDGKTQIAQLQSQVEQLQEQNEKLHAGYAKTTAKLMLEQKTKGLSRDKRDYMMKVMGDKTPSFINENFDYTLRLFDSQDRTERKILKEEAYKKRVVRDEPKRVPTRRLVKESNAPTNAYLEGLGKFK